jgi:hypothetical protein
MHHVAAVDDLIVVTVTDLNAHDLPCLVRRQLKQGGTLVCFSGKVWALPAAVKAIQAAALVRRAAGVVMVCVAALPLLGGCAAQQDAAYTDREIPGARARTDRACAGRSGFAVSPASDEWRRSRRPGFTPSCRTGRPGAK